NELVSVGECDVGVKVSFEPELEALLIQVALEVEQECLDPQLRAAERGTVADRQRGDEAALAGDGTSGICAEGRNKLVRLDPDVRGGKPQAAPDLVSGFDRT